MSDILQYGNYLTFDGIQSNTYGVWISGTGTYNAPERDVEFIQIPGKSGDLIVDNGRFNNIEITYPAFISKNFDTRFDTFRALMLSKIGYFTLEDTYHPNEYRKAAIVGGFEAETGPYNKSGRFDITFNCQPQRYLKSGLTTVTFTANGTISNPTAYIAKPLVRVYGYGTVKIGGTTVTIATNSLSYIDLDCDAMDAFYGATNANQYITLSSSQFPALNPGSNGVTKSGNVTRIEITPRWFTL